MDPTPTPMELLQRAMQLHADTLIDHKERLGVHQHWLTAYAAMLEQHHLRMDQLQATVERIDVTLAAVKDLLNRPNGH
jgi:hypothetical protein